MKRCTPIRLTTLLIATFVATIGAACAKEQPTSSGGAQPALPAGSQTMTNGMPMQAHSGYPMGGGPMGGAPMNGTQHEMGNGMMNHPGMTTDGGIMNPGMMTDGGTMNGGGMNGGK